MAFTGSVVAITSTGVQTVAASTGNGPMDVFVKFATTGPAYLGSSGVTSSGYALSTADHSPFTVRIMPGETLYGASTATISLTVMKHYDW
jgi:hypothetical protein